MLCIPYQPIAISKSIKTLISILQQINRLTTEVKKDMTEEKETEEHSEISENIPHLKLTTASTSSQDIIKSVKSLNLDSSVNNSHSPPPYISIKVPNQAGISGPLDKTGKPTSPGDRSRLSRAMSSPTLHIPTRDRELYQRSLTLNSPGLSPSFIDTGTSQVFVFIPQNQDPLTGADKGQSMFGLVVKL